MLSVTGTFCISYIEDFPSDQNLQQFKVFGLEHCTTSIPFHDGEYYVQKNGVILIWNEKNSHKNV